MKHQISPFAGLSLTGASLSAGISGWLLCGSVLGTGGMISGSGRFGSLSIVKSPGLFDPTSKLRKTTRAGGKRSGG
jgi:hypothetical protein